MELSAKNFYDQIAPSYHLLFTDWEESMARQAKALDSVLRGRRLKGKRVLDLACGIGTQSLGLARMGYQVTAADISPLSVRRARREAARRLLKLDFAVADMRQAGRHFGPDFDVVIACDNAVPHLLSDAEILGAFREARKCLKPGGLYLISVRDYERELRAGEAFKYYGERQVGAALVSVFQTRRYFVRRYELAMAFVTEKPGRPSRMEVARSTYYAVGIRRLVALMKKAGFKAVRRMDKAFYQPLLVGEA